VGAVDVPEAPVRGLPARQQRVGDILGAAWEDLPAADQAVLRWLPLFSGGFTREAFRVVAGGSPQQLLRLLDVFLVAAADGGRYELPELVRRFAVLQQAGRPEERARQAARHAAYFADFVQERAAALPRSLHAMAEVESERANILAAWECAAAQGHPDLLERMRSGLRLFHELAAPHDAAAGPAIQIQARPLPDPTLATGGALEMWDERELAVAAP
jgi:hypothetical protein